MMPQIGPETRETLLDAARSVLEGTPPRSAEREPASAPVSVFVTLRRGDELRGCIGVLESRETLAEAVEQCALAASRDPRFPPLDAGEVPEIRIEISVLGGWTEIGGPAEIVPGRDGLLVIMGRSRGLLLPQVAVEQGWDARRFLEQTCVKAGLPRDAWEKGAQIRSFRAEVFSEAGPELSGPGSREPSST